MCAVRDVERNSSIRGRDGETIDLDFLFRKTSRKLAKLKAVARALGATVLRPYYPVSDLYRIARDDDGLQVDFMGAIHGVRSFDGVRGRATVVDINGVAIRVATLEDVIRSKKAARRPRDLAVIAILEKALEASRAAKETGRPRQGK